MATPIQQRRSFSTNFPFGTLDWRLHLGPRGISKVRASIPDCAGNRIPYMRFLLFGGGEIND
jgi:hypothetical protein